MKQSDYSASSWLKFFSSAGIAKEFAEVYAVTFSKNQINLDMLPEIKKEYLVDMGITLMGHIIAILRHAKTVYSETVTKTTLSSNGTKSSNTSTNKTAQTEKPIVKTTPIVISKNDPPSAPLPRVESHNNQTKSTVVKMRPAELPQKRKQEEETANPVKKVKVPSQQIVQTSKNIQAPVKSVRLIENPKKVEETEGRKHVFARLGNDNSPSSSDTSSSGESVFARLGDKTLDESPPPVIIRTAAPLTRTATPHARTGIPKIRTVSPKMRTSNPQSRTPTTAAIKPVRSNGALATTKPTVKFNNDLFLAQKSTSLTNLALKGTMRADEADPNNFIAKHPSSVPSLRSLSITNNNNAFNKRDIHSRLGWPKKDPLSKTSSSATFKQVRFGGITEKVIPREIKSDFKVGQLRSYSFDEPVNTKRQIGMMSSGVFSRLGV